MNNINDLKIIRKLYLKKITNNLGKIVEEDDKIICYLKDKQYTKDIILYNIPTNSELTKKLNINKPIYYVLDGLSFSKGNLCIYGYHNCNVIIKNCSFNNYIQHIDITGDCIIENCSFKSCHSIVLSATNLILNNMDINNFFKTIGIELQVYIGADNKLEIKNSYIGRVNENTDLFLYSSNATIDNSMIRGDYIELKSRKINTDKNSMIKAKEEVSIKSDDFSEICISSPNIIYNKRKLSPTSKKTILKKPDEISLKRIELLELLKLLKEECTVSNEKKITKYQEKLYNEKPLKKILN